MKEIEPVSIDKWETTWVTIGCYRETERLGRVLSTYQKALTLADRDNLGFAFVSGLASLHDHKGELTASWNSKRQLIELRKYIDRAWLDCGEALVRHNVGEKNMFDGEAELLKW